MDHTAQRAQLGSRAHRLSRNRAVGDIAAYVADLHLGTDAQLVHRRPPLRVELRAPDEDQADRTARRTSGEQPSSGDEPEAPGAARDQVRGRLAHERCPVVPSIAEFDRGVGPHLPVPPRPEARLAMLREAGVVQFRDERRDQLGLGRAIDPDRAQS